MRLFRTLIAAAALTLGASAGAAPTFPPYGQPLVKANNLSDALNPPASIDNLVGQHPAPTYTDDSSFGHAVGDLWTTPSGQVYQAQEVGVGAATWALLPVARAVDLVGYPVVAAAVSAGGSGYAVSNTITMPNGTVLTVATLSGSAVATVTISTPGEWGCNTPSNPVAQSSTSGSGTGATFNLTLGGPAVALGTAVLTNCYVTNSAIDLTLVNGPTSTVKTIGFVGGAVDAASADAFCAPSPLTCYVTKWYDQSGNANNVSQTAGASAPIWSSVNSLNGYRPVVFNSQPHTLSGWAVGINTKYLQSATAFSWTPSSSTWLFAGRFNVSSENRAIMQETGASRGILASYTGGSQSGMAEEGVGVICKAPAPVGPGIVVFTWGTSATCWSNNQTATTSGGGSQGATTDVVVGSTQTANPSNWDGLAWIQYSRNLSTAETLNGRAGLASQFRIAMQGGDTVDTVGDSMWMGEGSLYDASQNTYGIPAIRKNIAFINQAVFGMACNGASGSYTLFTVIGPGATGVYSSTARNFIVHLLIGPNDVRNAYTASQIETCWKNEIAAVHALGANAKVVFGVPPLQCDIYNNSVELAVWTTAYNWAIANWNVAQANGGLGADGLANYWADPTIGVGAGTASSAFCSSTYAVDSSQHPSDLSMQFMAPIFANAINSLLH